MSSQASAVTVPSGNAGDAVSNTYVMQVSGSRYEAAPNSVADGQIRGLQINATGMLAVNATQAGIWTVNAGARSQANAPVNNHYATTNVTTAAWVQLVASLTSATSYLEIFDTSGSILKLATGGAGSEVAQLMIPPGGQGLIPFKINAGTRISIEAVDTNAVVGDLILNFYT